MNNLATINRIRALRREAEQEYQAGRWQNGYTLEDLADRAELEIEHRKWLREESAERRGGNQGR